MNWTVTTNYQCQLDTIGSMTFSYVYKGVSMEESQTPGKDPAATPPAGPPGGEKQISYYVSDLEKSCDHFPCLMVMIGSAVAFSVVSMSFDKVTVGVLHSFQQLKLY